MIRFASIGRSAALLGAVAGLSLSLASPAGAAEQSDWTNGADQYTEYIVKLQSFTGALNPVAPMAVAPGRAQFPKNRKGRKAYATARGEYNRAVAKEERARIKASARAVEDLERMVGRAQTDSDTNLENRNSAIQNRYELETAALEAQQESLDESADSSYATQMEAATSERDRRLNDAQNAYNGARGAAQETYERAERSQFVKREKAQDACRKKYDEKKETGKRKNCLADADHDYDKIVKGIKGHPQYDDDKSLQGRLRAANREADAAFKGAQDSANADYDKKVTELEGAYGSRSSAGFEREQLMLEQKLELALARSQRQFEEEARLVEDIQVKALRTIEDLYEVEEID